jgi:GNAT superfamily N-acetyltransferase
VVLSRQPRVSLVVPSVDELAAIRDVAATGRHWVVDYPTDGDVLLARIAVESGTPATEQAPWGLLQVRLNDGGEAVGGAGFKNPPDGEGTVEIGYGLAPSVHGRGLATEAVHGLLEIAGRHGVQVVLAETDAANIASQRVLQKCGFQALPGSDAERLSWQRTVSAPR